MTEPVTESTGGRREASPSIRRAFHRALVFVALLWAVRLVETVTAIDLTAYGIYPRRVHGLPGILTGPLIHGSWEHLIANTAPVLVLGTALLYGYPRCARIVLPVVYLGAGLAVWLLARPAFHLGSSGLAFGMLFFVFTMGVLRWEPRAIALAMIVSFLYGSMVWGVLPLDESVSFESHMAGAVIGVVLAWVLKHRDPPPPRRRYSWEDEEEDEDEPERMRRPD